MRHAFALIVASIALPLCAATLNVRPDTRVVDEDGSFQLSIRIDDSSPEAAPDFSALEQDFEVLGQRSASQFRSINGRVDAWTDWVLTLRPRRAGRLVIPPIKLGPLESAPITIEVKPIDPETKRRLAEMVRFETEFEPKNLYVQAQLVITRRLVYAEGAQLYGELPGDPVIDGAVVRSLNEARHTTETRDGRRFGVIAQRFVVFPERSGTLTVPGAAIVASVNLPRRDGGGFARREVRVASEPVQITVRPIPAEFPADAPWLPSEQVDIVEDWQSTGEWHVGAPRTRSLIVRADATAASRIAPLEISYPGGLKVYSDPPNISEQLGGAGVIGVRSETTRLVPTRPGELELPGVEVRWWNIKTETLEVTRLLPRREQVVGEAIAANESPAATPESATPEVPAASAQQETSVHTTSWWSHAVIAAILALAIGFAIASLLRYHRSPRQDERTAERRAYRLLEKACAARDPAEIRAALDAWLTARHGNLTAGLRAFCGDTAQPGASAVLTSLNAALYGSPSGKQHCPAFDPDTLLIAVRAHRKHRRRSERTTTLPGLYPDPGTAT